LSKKVLKLAITTVLIIAALCVGYGWWQNRNSIKKGMAQAMTTARVTRGNLEEVLKGSGTLLPMEEETINLKVDGTVKRVYFEEGDVVKKGDLLYELENDDLSIGLKKSQLSLAQQQLSLKEIQDQREKAVVYAPQGGVITAVNVKSGDSINTNSILATLQDPNKCQLRAPFISSQIKNLKLGQKAEVMFLDPIYTVEGEVTKLDTVGTKTASGSIYYYATIVVDGNYYVEGRDTKVQVHIVTDSGKEQAVEVVLIEPQEQIEIKPEIASTIKEIYIDEGDVVENGQKLFSLDVDEIDVNIEKQSLSLQQAELELQSKMSQMENLLVYSPIDGTIIEQNVREGDLIRPSANSSSSSESAAIIVNYSKMQVVLPIDELDINKIEIGMPVKVTAEAIPGQIFEGKVEKIAEQGKSQNNVSTFDVTITTDKVAGLKAGMTVDVELIAASKQDVLMLPISAIQYQNGKSYVMKVQGSGQNRQDRPNNDKNPPTTMVEVKTGISNEENIEIVSGLKEGDMVLFSNSSTGSNSNRFGGGPGGQMGPMGPVQIMPRPN
jgi:HlyD family secretion protein